jgi:hypothetical protein
MNEMRLTHAMDLNSDHCDSDPHFGTGFSGFIFPQEAALGYSATKSLLYHTLPRQDLEGPFIRNYEDWHFQIGVTLPVPLRRHSAIHSHSARLGKADEHQLVYLCKADCPADIH